MPVEITHMPARSAEGHVNVFVEILRGSRNKYEYDEELGVIRLDRALYSAVHYPTDYGFVPGTRSADGELIDALLMVEESTFPGCLVQARLLGVLTIAHGGGLPEQKLLCVPIREPRFAEYNDISDVPTHLLKEIEHFFDVFKDLEDSEVATLGWEGVQQAHAVLEAAIDAAQAKGE
jgi:inorganic pyrophosphatase